MLQISNLEVVYNDVVLVLRGISLEVPTGKIVALLGANGAGKTTTMRATTGLLDVHEGEITKGQVVFDGIDITDKDPSYIVRNGISQVMEGRRIFAEMTVDENLQAGAFTNSNRARVGEALDRVMALFPQIAHRRKSVAGYLSGGEQQMLG
ncbi:MAG: ATP-binding cassette domain-containing protein, partial [Acidimicrobiia bacterium]